MACTAAGLDRIDVVVGNASAAEASDGAAPMMASFAQTRVGDATNLIWEATDSH